MTQHIPELPDSSLIEFINCYVESPMTDQELQLEIDNGLSLKKSRRIAFWLGLAFVVVVAAWCASVSAQGANSATITFTPSTQYTDGTSYPSGAVVTYDLYQGLKGVTRVKVGTVTSGGSITTGLLTGNEYCWDVVTVLKVGATPVLESAHSLPACKSFTGTPGVVTITVT